MYNWELPYARLGEKLTLVEVEGRKILRKEASWWATLFRRPPQYRQIDDTRDPPILVDGHETWLHWVPEFWDYVVAPEPDGKPVRFKELAIGTKIQLVNCWENRLRETFRNSL